MRNRSRSTPPFLCAALSIAVCSGTAVAVEPGVDIAVPRVLISTVDSALLFHPARQILEQGDYVRWSPQVASVHTTTSGSPCVADGLWSASLGTVGVNFTRQFLETPQVFPYFCSPHCGFNMVGQVMVTGLIALTVSDSPGTSTLSWGGGGGLYQVIRSDNPAFRGPNTATFTPDGGGGGTMFTDLFTPVPAAGAATFYLVMNQQ
ncbi:MAG: hypothetical protein AUI47_10155 [Acidobacteria bacterium 13_1_40CM_2_68_5]|nr:MAG: hypothetical protein AUI47_10155 [Acidobacteria bacterium 13_1_40CM_2_68_5]